MLTTIHHHRPPSTVGPYRLGAVHELQLRDGSLHQLVQLIDNGVPSRHLRALQPTGSQRLQVFDARKLARSLAADLCTAPDRDVPGLVLFSLRGIYRNADALERAVADVAMLTAVPVPVIERAEVDQ